MATDTATQQRLNAGRVTILPPEGKFTTVMQWNSYASAQYGDPCTFGMKFSLVQSLSGAARKQVKIYFNRIIHRRSLRSWHGFRNPLEVT